MTESKSALRTRLRAAREAFVEETGRKGDLLVAHLLVAERVVPRLGDARCVAGYLSDGFEVDPLPILFHCIDQGMTVVLPRVEGRDRPMRFLRWLPGDPLESGPLGLMQPEADVPEGEPDLILAPLLGFDRHLNRLGQGAGFYDRAFAARREARRIGLAWSVQEVERLPLEAWDLPVQGVATEQRWVGP